MGDDGESGISLPAEAFNKIHYACAVSAIQICGRFVGEDDPGVVCEGSGE